jgi:hypothetical protein
MTQREFDIVEKMIHASWARNAVSVALLLAKLEEAGRAAGRERE